MSSMLEAGADLGRRLDDPAFLRAADPGGMLAAIAEFPAQCRRAWDGGRPPAVLPKTLPPRRLFCAGMGGSAIGADLLRAYLNDRGRTPVQVVRNYRLPACAGGEDTAIACSYSGETEESLSAYRDAKERGLFTICLTSGGRLAELGGASGDPVVPVPPTVQPRAALGSFFFLLLNLAADLKIFEPEPGEIDETLALMEEKARDFSSETPLAGNQAKRLALAFHGRFPIFYTADTPLGPVGDRWRCQLNENAKVLAHSAVIPEMCHNEIEGWRFPDNLMPLALPVFLRGRPGHPRVETRFEIVQGVLKSAGFEPISLRASGETDLAGIFHLILLGDFVSFYLAVLNGIDPTPMAKIDRLKALLQETENSPKES